jgi:hypothetical protein
MFPNRSLHLSADRFIQSAGGLDNMKQLSGVVILSVAFLSGCGEPNYEQCIREAVEDGKNEYGMQLLRGLCNEAEQKRRRIADKQCFSDLAKRYGVADIQYYKNVLASSEEKCDPSVNLLSWAIQQREVEKAADAAVAEGMNRMNFEAAEAAKEAAK